MAKKKPNKFFSVMILIVGLFVSGALLYAGMGLFAKNSSLFGLIWVVIAIIALIIKKDTLFR